MTGSCVGVDAKWMQVVGCFVGVSVEGWMRFGVCGSWIRSWSGASADAFLVAFYKICVCVVLFVCARSGLVARSLVAVALVKAYFCVREAA